MGLLGRAHPGVMLRFESRFHSTSSSNAAIWEPTQGPFWLNIVVFGFSFLYQTHPAVMLRFGSLCGLVWACTCTSNAAI